MIGSLSFRATGHVCRNAYHLNEKHYSKQALRSPALPVKSDTRKKPPATSQPLDGAVEAACVVADVASAG